MSRHHRCRKRRSPRAEAIVHPGARAESQNLDPICKPEQPVPWYKLDPEAASLVMRALSDQQASADELAEIRTLIDRLEKGTKS